jgi:hypothetical protein
VTTTQQRAPPPNTLREVQSRGRFRAIVAMFGPALRTGCVRRPGNLRDQFRGWGAVQIPVGLGHRDRQCIGDPHPVPQREDGAWRLVRTSRGFAASGSADVSISCSGSRPRWWRWQLISLQQAKNAALEKSIRGSRSIGGSPNHPAAGPWHRVPHHGRALDADSSPTWTLAGSGISSRTRWRIIRKPLGPRMTPAPSGLAPGRRHAADGVEASDEVVPDRGDRGFSVDVPAFGG